MNESIGTTPVGNLQYRGKSGGGDMSDGAPIVSGPVWPASERAFRREIGKARFSETQLRILDKIVMYSIGRGRFRALIPKQRFFEILCGLDKGDVSRALDWLQSNGVVERDRCFYALVPPPWRVPARAPDTQELRDLERWLEELDPDQPDLLPAPPSLNDALREVFTESLQTGPSGRATDNLVEAPGKSRGAESRGAGARPPWDGAPAESRVESRVGSSESMGREPRQEIVGENPTRAPSQPEEAARVVGNSPTACARPPEPPEEPSRAVGNYPTHAASRAFESRTLEKTRTQSREPSTRARGFDSGGSKIGDAHAHVEQRLFETIGQHERNGQCRVLWARAVREIPNELDELIGHALMLQREGRCQNIGAWLNRATYRALSGARPSGK